jgi:hypothetical protein
MSKASALGLDSEAVHELFVPEREFEEIPTEDQ